MRQKVILVGTAALLLSVFAAASMLYTQAQADAAARLAAANRSALVRPHSPTLGKADAPVVIVEFFDPACGTCQAFYSPVKGLFEEHPDRVRLVLRYAPFQLGAEDVVAVLEAARKQNGFWPVLDALMNSQDDWKPLHEAELARVWKHLEGLGLDLERLRKDMADPEIARRIAADLEDAARLKVDSTPEFFVNGEPLPGFGFGVLKQAVEAALKGV